MMIKKWSINYIGWKGSLFIWNDFRLNGSGYLYGAAPYNYWRIGPVMIKRYV